MEWIYISGGKLGMQLAFSAGSEKITSAEFADVTV